MFIPTTSMNDMLKLTGAARTVSTLHQAMLDDMNGHLSMQAYSGHHNGYVGQIADMGGAPVLLLMSEHANLRGLEREAMTPERVLRDVAFALNALLDVSFSEDKAAMRVEALLWESSITGTQKDRNGQWYVIRDTMDGLALEIIHEDESYIVCLQHTDKVWCVVTVMAQNQRKLYPDQGYAAIRDGELASWSAVSPSGFVQEKTVKTVKTVSWLSVPEVLQKCKKWHPCLRMD